MNASHTEKIRTSIPTKLHQFLDGSFSVFFCGRTDRQTDSDTYEQTSLNNTVSPAWLHDVQWLSGGPRYIWLWVLYLFQRENGK